MDSQEARDFKRTHHFRNCADRNCLNCKFSSDACDKARRSFCYFLPEDGSKSFQVCQFTVCDNWKRKREPLKSGLREPEEKKRK